MRHVELILIEVFICRPETEGSCPFAEAEEGSEPQLGQTVDPGDEQGRTMKHAHHSTSPAQPGSKNRLAKLKDQRCGSHVFTVVAVRLTILCHFSDKLAEKDAAGGELKLNFRMHH